MNKFFKALIGGALAAMVSSAALAQCGTTAPANKFCGNDTGSSALAGWKSIPAGALTPIPGGTVLGNPTAASAVPSATTAPVLGIPGTSTGQIGLAGATGGTAILRAQAVAGSAVSLLPTAAGTLVSTATAPLAISATTGLISVTGLAGGVLAGSAPAFTVTPLLGVSGSVRGTVGFSGLTSGAATLQSQDIAGTPTIKLPSVSGNLALVSATTGAITASDVTYTAPFTGSVAETQTAYNAQRVSIADFGSVTGTSVANATVNAAAFNSALVTGKQVYVPLGEYNLGTNTINISSGQSVVCEPGAIIYGQNSAKIFYVSSLGPNTDVARDCILQMGINGVNPPAGSTAIRLATALANVNQVSIVNVICRYTYECVGDEGTNYSSFITLQDVRAEVSYGRQFYFQKSNGFINLTRVECDLTQTALGVTVSWVCGKLANFTGAFVNDWIVATGYGLAGGVPTYNSAGTGWVFENGISLYADHIKADTVVGDGCIFNGVSYVWIVKLDCGFNLGNNAIFTNTAGTSTIVQIGQALLIGGNTYQAASKAGLVVNNTTHLSIATAVANANTGAAVEITGSSANINIGSLDAYGNTGNWATVTGTADKIRIHGGTNATNGGGFVNSGTGTEVCAEGVVGLTTTCTTPASTLTGNLPIANAPSVATNTVLGNATSGTATVTALSVGSCSTAASALIWTTNTGFGCNTSITAAAVPASGLTGATLAAGVTASSLTSLGTITSLNATAIGAGTPGSGLFTSLGYSTTLTGTSANASALAVGRLGATTPALQVDASTATSITGIKVKSAATTGGVDLSAIGETNVNLRIDANGSGTIALGGTSTGAISLGRATTINTSLTGAFGGTSNVLMGATSNYGYLSFNNTGTLASMVGVFGGASGDSSTLYLAGTVNVSLFTALNFVPGAASNSFNGTNTLPWLSVNSNNYISKGTVPTGTTGSCVASSFAGGATAGRFSAAVCAAGTFILSGLPAAPTGYACSAWDQTTIANTVRQTASSTTSVTFTATTTAADVIAYHCMAY